MRCPKCGSNDDKVIDSRAVKEGAGVRRRRECIACACRFTTIEGIIPEELKVIKNNSIREDYDRDKLRRGITNACYKRPVSSDDIDRVVEEVSSREIGNRVMEQLRKVDQVAYVRFASVYRKFKDVEEFIEEIRALK